MPLSNPSRDHLRFKDHSLESQLFRRRMLVSALLVVVLFATLIARFYTLQVVDHQDYVTRADSNRIQVQPVAPTRGLIFDRNGVLLADNRASYTLSIVKERTQDLEQTIDKVAELITVEDDDRKAFYKALRQRRRPYEAVPLRYRLTEAEIARIAVNEYQLEGVEVEAQLVRYYPHGELFAHAIGYVGRINERELQSFDEETYRRYSGTHTIGKTGLEKSYEEVLLGEVGSQHIETNAHGRVLRVLERIDPKPGKDLHLHLDIEIQRAARKALEGHRGAVVAMDVHTGGVLALVSEPSFDANLFVTGISYRDYRELSQSHDLPLFNRALQGQYPPGSTLKPMLGVGGLEYSAVSYETKIRDPGYYQPDGDTRIFRDWKRGGHGHRVDLRQAIVESCDTFFYDLAVRMGIGQMHPVGEAFGLGRRTGIDVPAERSGLWPSRPWKQGARGLPWFPGDSLNVSIGQGDVLATPVQLAVMTTTLATRGTLFRPQVVGQVGGQPVAPVVLGQWSASDEHWDYVHSAMEGVVHSRSGTAKVIAPGINYHVAGKTGTAQVISIAQDERYDRDEIHARQRDHALFIAFAPAEDPQVAVAVIVENGEHGSSVAAPVARQVLDSWFAQEAERRARSELVLAPGESDD